MKIPLFSCLFWLPFSTILLISSQCLDEDRSLLLQLKGTLVFDSSFSTKLVKWDSNSSGSADCCLWNGVDCDENGRVIGLDLYNETISNGLDNSSGLFRLQYLQKLNLGANRFTNVSIPYGLGNLTNLRYLNLSRAGFIGQIPIELSKLIRLESFDLSALNFPGSSSLVLDNQNLSMLFQNLLELKELHLDGVNISATGSEWSKAISSLNNLKVLSLSNCYLSGPIDHSMKELSSLSLINLSQNNLSAQVPDFFAHFTNLTLLMLSSCNLQGIFPENILQVSTLQLLDLSQNPLLEGFLPEFHENAKLQTLVLSYTNFSGKLPFSIGNLKELSTIELVNCSFTGTIPSSLENLTQLVHLDLSTNKFSGPISSFARSKNLTHVDLSHNELNGSIHSTDFQGLTKLETVNLGSNSFSGNLPSSLFELPSLQKMLLSDNKFDGNIPKFSNASNSQLDTLDLSGNNLTGFITTLVTNLQKLNILSLQSNNFMGTIKLEALNRLSNLTSLDLSFNNLLIDASATESSISSFPKFTRLFLASCKLQKFPDLRNQSKLYYLDLSDNQISGEIPNWIWKVGNGAPIHLNLSLNFLVGFQEPYDIPSLSVLDLHSNKLGGEIPIPPAFVSYVDYSSNNFNSSIPVGIGNKLTFAYFFSLSNNSLTGTIPESICNTSYLRVLDLSNNGLTGQIPPCLIERSSGILGVLNLHHNNLTGNIYGNFSSSCTLKTLDLNGNRLNGHVPKSLANCKLLEVLNLGNNMINDVYPCFLKSSANLRVLVLRNNKFHGGILCGGGNKSSWQKLQIIDLAMNYFGGELPSKCFLHWNGMIVDADSAHSGYNHLHFQFLQFNNFYYQDTVTVTNKGLQMELVKILTIFTSIDFSSNNFTGHIPDTVGALKSLYVLNLSDNALTGPIPTSIGNLTQLGSLDLSMNNLSGSIPVQLASLTFLSFLNLSYNLLVGSIPTGSQFQTFTNASFIKNKGLCGPPLSNSCFAAAPAPNSHKSSFDSVTEFDWGFIIAGLGFGVGAAIIVWPLMFWKQGRIWSNEQIDKVALIILSSLGITYSVYDVKVEAADNMDEDEKKDEEDEVRSIQGRYCVYCSELDIYWMKVRHDPQCSCYG